MVSTSQLPRALGVGAPKPAAERGKERVLWSP